MKIQETQENDLNKVRIELMNKVSPQMWTQRRRKNQTINPELFEKAEQARILRLKIEDM